MMKDDPWFWLELIVWVLLIGLCLLMGYGILSQDPDAFDVPLMKVAECLNNARND